MNRADSYYFALNPRVVESVDAFRVSILFQIGYPHYTRIDDETGALPAWAEGNVQLSPEKGYSMTSGPGDSVLFRMDGTTTPQLMKLHALRSAMVSP